MPDIIQIGPDHYAQLEQTANGKWFANILVEQSGQQRIEEYTDDQDSRDEALEQAKSYWQMMYGPLREWETFDE
jgi:hypothetical protein